MNRNSLHLILYLVSTLIIAGVLIVGASPAHAQSTQAYQCQTINNDDARSLCVARATHQPGSCGTINNDDKRHYCEAVAARDPYRCNTINDDDQRNLCKAESR